MGAILFWVDDLSEHYESWLSGAVLSWFQGINNYPDDSGVFDQDYHIMIINQ